MAYPLVQKIEHTRLVDISASAQTLPMIAISDMVVYGLVIKTTEAWGTIDTGTVSLAVGATTYSTATPVTSGAVGTEYQGTQMTPLKVAAGTAINIVTVQDAVAGTAEVYLLAEIFPNLAPA